MKKKLLAVLAAVGVALAIIGYGMKNRHAASIGIIGGADGPTVIFVAGKTGLLLHIGVAILAAVLVAFFVLRRRKKK